MLDFTFFLWKYSAMVQNNMQATFIQIRPVSPMAQVWHNCLQVNWLQVTLNPISLTSVQNSKLTPQYSTEWVRHVAKSPFVLGCARFIE